MSEKEKFHIHTNRELKDRSGKPMKFYSEKDYTRELKSRGLEQYKGEAPARKKSEYRGVSDEAKRMINSVSYDKSGKPNIGDRYIDALKSMGVRNVPKELINKQHGGWK